MVGTPIWALDGPPCFAELVRAIRPPLPAWHWCGRLGVRKGLGHASHRTSDRDPTDVPKHGVYYSVGYYVRVSIGILDKPGFAMIYIYIYDLCGPWSFYLAPEWGVLKCRFGMFGVHMCLYMCLYIG